MRFTSIDKAALVTLSGVVVVGLVGVAIALLGAATLGLALALSTIPLGIAGVLITESSWLARKSEANSLRRRIRAGEIYPTHPEFAKDRR